MQIDLIKCLDAMNEFLSVEPWKDGEVSCDLGERNWVGSAERLLAALVQNEKGFPEGKPVLGNDRLIVERGNVPTVLF